MSQLVITCGTYYHATYDTATIPHARYVLQRLTRVTADYNLSGGADVCPEVKSTRSGTDNEIGIGACSFGRGDCAASESRESRKDQDD